MEHVRLDATGLKASRLCLGAVTFGLPCDQLTREFRRGDFAR